jgi:hypothetical protein
LLDNAIIDDKNMPGNSLGIRRIQTQHKNLLPLRKAVENHIGIIKQTKPYFVDSNGLPFIYEKTAMCKLEYYKIRKVERKDVASLLWLKDLTHPLRILRPPEDGKTWAGILHLYGLPWMLYEYSDEHKKGTRRKV